MSTTPTLRVLATAAATTRAAAALVADRLRAQPALVMGLPTGRTMIGFYRELVRLHAAGQADCSRVHAVGLDEFAGLGPDDHRSFRAFLRQHLFRHVNMPAEQVHTLDGSASDVLAECVQFDHELVALGGLDLLLLGVGENGHIGFNEPGATQQTRTHRARLTLQTRRANAGRFGGRAAAVPRTALTMGIATMLQARSIVLVATGASKARAVSTIFNGRITSQSPASFLQLHRDVLVLADRAAAPETQRTISP